MERVDIERHARRHLLTPEELKRIRIDLGLTQSKMSELLGISSS